MGQPLVRALHIGLDDKRQGFLFALAHLLEHILEFGRLLFGELHVAELPLPEERDLARLPLVTQHEHIGTRGGNVRKTEDLDRNRGPPFLDGAPSFIQHRTHAAKHRARQ
ncbi:hypothetical protein D3C83_48390 [compost metagenome]